MRAGSTGAQSVLPSELDEQTPCGFASHVKPAGHAVPLLAHLVTPLWNCGLYPQPAPTLRVRLSLSLP